MKRMVLSAILLTTLGGAALADSNDSRWSRNDDRANPSRDQGDNRGTRGDEQRRYDDHRDDRYGRYDDRRYDRDRYSYERRDWRYDRGRYSPPRGYAPRYWRHGDRLPRGYMGRPYLLHDYRAVRLYQPPRGHHWVRVNHDVVLAAIATGIVIDVLYNRFY
jgi:Ni/Co efflux regulator RcnB